MSTLAALPYWSTASHSFSELEATQEISRIAARAEQYNEALEGILEVALAVAGVWRVSIVAPPEVGEWLNRDRSERAPRSAWECAIAPVAAGLLNWGQLRIWVDGNAEVRAGALGFVRYLGQQIAAVLDRLALRDQYEVLGGQLRTLKRRLEVKKAVTRAIGIVARRDGGCAREALRQITAIARRQRRSLLLTAQAVIFLEGEGGSLRSPTFRRLMNTETTGG